MPFMEVCVLLRTRLILPRISGRPHVLFFVVLSVESAPYGTEDN